MEDATYSVRPIGIVRSSLRDIRDAPNQAFEGAPQARLEIDPACDKDWVWRGASAFGWLAPGELRLFEPSEREEARAWLGATSSRHCLSTLEAPAMSRSSGGCASDDGTCVRD
jgi:hypothetical protein